MTQSLFKYSSSWLALPADLVVVDGGRPGPSGHSHRSMQLPVVALERSRSINSWRFERQFLFRGWSSLYLTVGVLHITERKWLFEKGEVKDTKENMDSKNV